MGTEYGISIVVPAYNESGSILPTLHELLDSLAKFSFNFEIIIVDDCSTDATLGIVSKFIEKSMHCTVISHKKNAGFGAAFKTGVAKSRYSYILCVPADCAYTSQAFNSLFSNFGRLDVITTYTINTGVRPIIRRVLSRIYSSGLNFFFNMKLKYFNGISIVPTKLVQGLDLGNHFSFMAETLITAIKIHELKLIEIPVCITERKQGKSKALKLRVVGSVMWRLSRLRFLTLWGSRAPNFS